MKLDVLKIKNDGYKIIDSYGDDLFVIKGFCSKELCKNSIKKAHLIMKEAPHRQVHEGVFFSFDVHPSSSETDKLFRTIEFYDSAESPLDNDFEQIFKPMNKFQTEYVLSSHHPISENEFRRPRLIHYPKGGGFFDWHAHPRYPVNYGLILNLSENGINFDEGATEFLRNNGERICVEDFTDIGDLILFKYDQKHRVAPCNPKDDLIFDINGRWTAVMPIY